MGAKIYAGATGDEGENAGPLYRKHGACVDPDTSSHGDGAGMSRNPYTILNLVDINLNKEDTEKVITVYKAEEEPRNYNLSNDNIEYIIALALITKDISKEDNNDERVELKQVLRYLLWHDGQNGQNA